MTEAMSFRNQLDGLSERFATAYTQRDARAAAEVYAEDAVLLLPNAPPIKGRTEIAASLQAAMDDGIEFYGTTTTHSEFDGRVGYAIQTVKSNRLAGNMLIALRCDDDGIWLITCEAAPDG